MSSFIRPALKQELRRWAETAVTACLTVFGVFLIWRGIEGYNSILQSIGLVIFFVGIGLLWTAVRRAQFHRKGDGPGLIEVTERQVTYLAPYGGGSVDLEAMTRLEIRSSVEFGRVWVLKQSEGASLFIPVAAAGSDTLFDAFSTLPDIDVAKLVSAVNSDSDQRDVIWRGSPRFRALT